MSEGTFLHTKPQPFMLPHAHSFLSNKSIRRNQWKCADLKLSKTVNFPIRFTSVKPSNALLFANIFAIFLCSALWREKFPSERKASDITLFLFDVNFYDFRVVRRYGVFEKRIFHCFTRPRRDYWAALVRSGRVLWISNKSNIYKQRIDDGVTNERPTQNLNSKREAEKFHGSHSDHVQFISFGSKI